MAGNYQIGAPSKEWMSAAPALAAALRNRAGKMVSLDTPQDQDLTDMGADITAGFVPGVGQAQAFRDFERGRRDGSAIDMALASLGMIPVVGGLRNVGKAKRAASAIADAPKPKRMSKQESIDAGFWHAIGLGKRLKRPYDEMTFTHERVKDVPESKIISLEDLQGQYVIPAVGDRTAAAKNLTEVDGIKLENPIYLEGGAGFMDTHGSPGAPDQSIWASKQGVTTKLRNKALDVQRDNPDAIANLLYVPMAHNSLNFSNMATDTAIEMLRSGRQSKKTLSRFDDAVRAIRPDFAGLSSPEVREQLKGNGAIRHAFLNRMQLDDFQQQGFPDLAAIRKAIMEPELADVPNYHGGYRIGQMDTSRKNFKDAVVPHSTYNTQIPGKVIGGLDVSIPYKDMWRDFFDNRRAMGQPEKGDRIAFERAAPSQLIDQQLLDKLMPMVEALRNQKK